MIFEYKWRESIAGIILAIGCSIPEMLTNIFSCTSSNPQMLGFGFGTIAGSGIFDFTVCLGIAAIFSYFYH